MKRPIEKALYCATLAVFGLGLAVAPALASSSSAGTSTGGFNAFTTEDKSLAPPLPQCLENSSDAILTLTNQPLLGGAPFTATVTIADEALQFNPAGTFLDDQCLIPGPVPATLSVPGGTNCPALYGREGEVAQVTTTSPCGGHIYEFEGLQQPCLPDAPVDPCAAPSAEFVGAYEMIQIP